MKKTNSTARVKPKHPITSIVYIKMDQAQTPHMVTGHEVRASGIKYIISSGQCEFTAECIELTTEADPLKKLL